MPTFGRWIHPLLALLRTRRGLLATIIALQALVLSFGLVVVFQDVRHSVAARLQDRILEQNVRTAESLAKTMEDLNFGEAYCGSVGRERAQRLIEELQLPAGGFVCLLDTDNKIICHPRLRQEPLLCGIDLSAMNVDRPHQTSTTIARAGREETIAGQARFLDRGIHYLAVKYIPSMKARIVVQQPESGLLAFGEAVASGSMLRAAGLGVVILMLTGAISATLIRRHNRVLESINLGLEQEVTFRVRESLDARHSLIIGLAKLAESRDTDTGQHLERICTYSVLLAHQLRDRFPEITDAWIDLLQLAASLHDIGKVGIPDNVLLKPGKLTSDERAVMERHPVIGADTLAAVQNRLGKDPLVDLSLKVARSHHERWDGNGYPDRIAGSAIPLAARIVALADVYDALTSVRVYKPAFSHEKATDIILAGRGTQFDPDVVDAFVRVADAFAATQERLNPAHADSASPVRLAA